MEKIRHYVLIVIFLLSITVPAFSDVHFALKLCNNHWYDRWLMTMAPEMSLTGQWFWISLDGTLGTVKPYGDEEGLILQSRWTIMSMLKIPFPGPFFASIGVGFSHSLRRVESKNTFADYTADTREKNQGELRALMGAEIPVSSSATVTSGMSSFSYRIKTTPFSAACR